MTHGDPQARALPTGARLGPYEVVDRIGAGGMGEVYRAPAQASWWMSLDPDDAPVILRDVSMWDLYVLDWEAP